MLKAPPFSQMTTPPLTALDSLPPDPRRRVAPATARNRGPILAVLERVYPTHGNVIEAASGTGEHAVHFASALPNLTWQPSDVDPDNLQSISAWTEATGVSNVRPPLTLDLGLRPESSVTPGYDAGFCANLIHIAPWRVCTHLMEFMSANLRVGAPLVLYGPYKVNHAHTSESNVHFEQWLQGLDAEYGVRDMNTVVEEASKFGLTFSESIPMPANNFCLLFHKHG